MARTVLALPDDGWRVWRDTEATWHDDRLYLPHDVDLAALPVNPPTGGWEALDLALDRQDARQVTLPSTVEANFWGAEPLAPLTPAEYFFASQDPMDENGIYYGVSWWWTDFAAGVLAERSNVVLNVPAARLRAEVFLNEQLVGYDLIGETPFDVQLGPLLREGVNRLAIRLTNPGGRYDWVDIHPAPDEAALAAFVPLPALKWGKQIIPMSHGFAGLDSGLTLTATDDVSIADIFVRNTPQVTDAFAEVTVLNRLDRAVAMDVAVAVRPHAGGAPLWQRKSLGIKAPPGLHVLTFPFAVPDATAWTPETPELYSVEIELAGEGNADRREQRFGFRWFTVTGLGTKAVWRLNGKRIRLRSSISWNWWALNGLFPTDDLVEKEIESAKALGLNTLTCHRNIGNARSLAATDRAGILRWEEPGSGRSAWLGDAFEQGYMREKIRRMILRDRNHPSLVIFGLQNEQVREAPLAPGLKATMDLAKSLDPTRIIILKSGFAGEGSDLKELPEVFHDYANKQAFYLPGDDAYHHDDGSGWSGWWDAHTVGGPGLYQDWLYQGPDDFSHSSRRADEIVFWGEALGSGSADALADAKAWLESHPDTPAFHREFHLKLYDALDAELDRLGFRGAFPTVDSLVKSIGDRTYHFWGRVLENVRISDDVDGVAISGWESAVIDQHCGLVDVFRNLKGKPALINCYAGPLHVAVKTRGVVFERGDRPKTDFYVVNETGRGGEATIDAVLIAPDGSETPLGKWTASLAGGDRFAELVAEAVELPALAGSGTHEVRARLFFGDEVIAGSEQLHVVAIDLVKSRDITVIEDGEVATRFLARAGFVAKPLAHAPTDRVVVVAANAASERPIGREVLEFVQAGGGVLLLADGRAIAERWASELGEAGVADYAGMIGPALSSWSGSWYLGKRHQILEGMPVDQALGWAYQADPRGSGAWFDPAGIPSFGDGVVWGSESDVETVVGYGKDHQPRLGASVSVLRYGKGRLVLSTLAGLYSSLSGTPSGFHPAAARKIVSNAVRFLSTAS